MPSLPVFYLAVKLNLCVDAAYNSPVIGMFVVLTQGIRITAATIGCATIDDKLGSHLLCIRVYPHYLLFPPYSGIDGVLLLDIRVVALVTIAKPLWYTRQAASRCRNKGGSNIGIYCFH